MNLRLEKDANSNCSRKFQDSPPSSSDFELLSQLAHSNFGKFDKINKKEQAAQGIDPLCYQIQVQYENTYQLEPTKGVPNTDKLRKILKNLISSELQDFSGRYSAFTAKYYCRMVADLIKNEMKDRVDPRYKIITYRKF